MALETTDKPTARDLLATGRVDPRKGSSRGHSYSELLAMNHLQPQPQDYDGSALQMVIQFAECIEGSNHVRQPFTSYCLRDTLHKILKNRDQISIGGIVDRIKENMLPLPANPDEIHALLIDIQRLSDEFDVHGEYTNEVQVRYMPLNYGSYPESLLQPFPMPASTVTADEPDSGIPGFSTVDNRGTLSNPLVHPPDYAEVVGVNLRAAATSRQEAPTGEEYVSRNSLSADSTIEDQETPDHYSYASDELPPSRRRALTQRLRRDETKPKYIKFGILFISFCCGFVVFLILGICGVVLYDGYSFISTTSVVQIDRQSVPLIVIHDLPTDLVRLTEFGTDFVPISFYTLRDCSSNDSFINVEINETITVNFSSPTDKSKPVTELYLARNTTVTVAITTVVLSNYETNHCVAFLFVFDNFDKFLSFTSSSFLVKEFYYKECIVNEQLQNMNITFDKPSYYYIGVYTDIPTEATTFSLHFVGTYLQYDISNKDAVCTIDSRDDLNCDFFPDYNNQQTCIVGFVPPISTDTPSEVTVSFYMYVGKYWETSIDSSFFTPLVLFIMLFLVLAYCLCTRKTE
ncbi:uncharacterized protein LOC135345411 isoform X2 [Halichondria panicea]|uniref:uncharacterized protein LOC135345411 isoform X2 n=1 Tax=Halichondria panicea TaxID=6063 RepID=UPI00312BC963